MLLALFIYGLTGGGATRRVITLAEGWARRGHEVRLLVVRPEGPLYERVRKGPLKLVPLDFGPLDPLLKKLPRRQQIFLSRWPLARYLRQEPPEIFLSAANHVHLVSLSARKKSREAIPLVLRVSNHIRASLTQKKGLKAFKSRLRLHFLKKSLSQADFIVAVSQGVLEDLLTLVPFPPQKTSVIYNPIDVKEIQRLAAQPVSHPWLREKKYPVVLGAGRLSAQKDFSTLLRAFAILRQRHPARLIILGEGKQRRKLEDLALKLGIRENVDLPGFSPNPWAYMARSDLFVLSSKWEGLPGVLLEALAVGCPVVSTDCPSGPREILKQGRLGPLVPVGESKALAQAMEKVLKAPPPRELLIARAKDFDLEKAVEAYLAVFEKVRKRHVP